MSDALADLIPPPGAADPGAVDAAVRGASAPPELPPAAAPAKNRGGRPKGRKDSAPRKPRSSAPGAPPAAAPSAPRSSAPAASTSAPRMTAADLHAPGIAGAPGAAAPADPAVVASLVLPLSLAFRALSGFAAGRFGQAAALDDDATEALASAWAPCLAPMMGGAASPWTTALVVTGAVVAPRALAVSAARRVQRAVPADAAPAEPNARRDPEPSPVTGVVLDLTAGR